MDYSRLLRQPALDQQCSLIMPSGSRRSRIGHGPGGETVASFRVAPLGVLQELIVPRTFFDAMGIRGVKAFVECSEYK